MENIIEKLHLKRLKEKAVVIEEIYQQNNTILIRTSDGKECDSVYKCPKIERNYYSNEKLLYRETEFNPNAKYSINSKKDTIEECTECGYKGPSGIFFDGCPYCGSQFNIEYSSTAKSNQGVVKSVFDAKHFKKAFLVIGIVSILITVIVSLISKDLTITIITFPISFIILISIYASALIPYFLYKIATIKDFPNSFIRINGELISNMHLLKDIQSELKKFYYNDNPNFLDLIDYEIIEYVDYQPYCNVQNEARINFILKIREYYLKENQLTKNIVTRNIVMLRNNNYIENNNKIRKCPYCGASITGIKDNCDYCRRKLPINKLWLLEKIS